MNNDSPAISAALLRRLIEKADGRRGIAQDIVRISRGDTVEYDVLTAEEIAARRRAGETIDSLMAIDAAHDRQSGRRRPDDAVTLVRAGRHHKLWTYTLGEVDAIFLSDSAVEKFVLPYYARTLPRPEYEELVQRYYSSSGDDDDSVLVHWPTSQYQIVEPDD